MIHSDIDLLTFDFSCKNFPWINSVTGSRVRIIGLSVKPVKCGPENPENVVCHLQISRNGENKMILGSRIG